MQYSTKDHMNQPAKNSGRKRYLWIGMEMSRNMHTHLFFKHYIYYLEMKMFWSCKYEGCVNDELKQIQEQIQKRVFVV